MQFVVGQDIVSLKGKENVDEGICGEVEREEEDF